MKTNLFSYLLVTNVILANKLVLIFHFVYGGIWVVGASPVAFNNYLKEGLHGFCINEDAITILDQLVP